MVYTLALIIAFVDYFEKILSLLILIRVVLSWFPLLRPNFLIRLVVDVTQPLFNLVNRLIPSLRKSVVDFSPIIVYFSIQILRDIIIRTLLAFV